MVEIINYVPESFAENVFVPDVHSTWKGLERIIPDVIRRFNIKPDVAVEFGVWYGFSAAALANFFQQVVGIDTFEGDHDAGTPSDLYDSAYDTLQNYRNVWLVRSDYQSYIRGRVLTANLIHIDIVHDYEPTYELGRWAVDHADVVLFHDTEAFPTVKQAVSDIAEETGRMFYNYPKCHGLGILVKP